MLPRIRYSRAVTAAAFRVEALEPRSLLSDTPLAGSGQGQGNGNQQVVVIHGPTPITDLTGNALTFSQVVGLPAVQVNDFIGLQRLLGSHGNLHPAIQHLDDIATLTSATTPIRLRGYTVMVDWGDGTAPTAGKLIVEKSTGIIHVKGLHLYQTAGLFNVVITLTQTTKSNGVTTTQDLVIDSTANVTQNSLNGVDVAATTGTPFTGIVGNFTGTGTDPTVFTALISWGDGSGASMGTVALNPDGTFSVSGDHTYSLAGSYRISIRVFQNPPAGVLHANPNNHGLHLGWRHSFTSAIFSTATVTDAAPPPPPPAP